jgi:hypothetical protein
MQLMVELLLTFESAFSADEMKKIEAMMTSAYDSDGVGSSIDFQLGLLPDIALLLLN